MKNVKIKLLVIISFLFAGVSFSQNSEFKINAPLSLAGFVEGSYERILNDESSVGVSLGFAYEDDFYWNAAAIPFYRFYFGKKSAAGFFAEANAALYSQDYDTYNSLMEEITDETDIGAGLGLAVGFKLKTNNNWIFEIFVGGGRNFLDDNLDSGYARLGLNLGKRF